MASVHHDVYGSDEQIHSPVGYAHYEALDKHERCVCVCNYGRKDRFLTFQSMASLSLAAPRDPRPNLLQEPPPCCVLDQLCSPARPAWLPGASACSSPTCWGQSAMCWLLAQAPKVHCQPTREPLPREPPLLLTHHLPLLAPGIWGLPDGCPLPPGSPPAQLGLCLP